ncbi:MAG: MaoC family dehydratase [Salinirussus sp.]
MSGLYFEDVDVGDTAATETGRTISEADVYMQAGLSGSYNRLHVDEEYMQTTDYGGRIVQNTLLITVMEGLNRRLGWDWNTLAAYGRENIRFTAPVYIGDTVTLTGEISDKREKSDESGVVTISHELSNQDDEVVLVGDYLLLIKRREGA